MTPENGHLVTAAPICWKQREQKTGFGNQPLRSTDLKPMGHISPSLCKQIIDVTYSLNKSVFWPGSDWLNNPGIR